MLRSAISLVAILSISIAASASADSIQIPRNVPYMDPTTVATKILNECTDLGTRLSTSLQQFSTQYGVNTVIVDEIDPSAEGRVFQLQITNVLSSGNAFIGHQKAMSAKGELFVNGESRGYVNFTRNSMGGFGGGFKGSCSVLARCAKTLGNDFAKWLQQND